MALLLLLVGLVTALAGWYFHLPIWRVERDVRAHLYDPEAARFSKVTFNAKKGTGCGLINAKNRMGGYTGETHFILRKDGRLEFYPEGDRDDENITRKIEFLTKEIAYVELMKKLCKQED